MQLEAGGTLYGIRSEGAYIARTRDGDRIIKRSCRETSCFDDWGPLTRRRCTWLLGPTAAAIRPRCAPMRTVWLNDLVIVDPHAIASEALPSGMHWWSSSTMPASAAVATARRAPGCPRFRAGRVVHDDFSPRFHAVFRHRPEFGAPKFDCRREFSLCIGRDFSTASPISLGTFRTRRTCADRLKVQGQSLLSFASKS